MDGDKKRKRKDKEKDKQMARTKQATKKKKIAKTPEGAQSKAKAKRPLKRRRHSHSPMKKSKEEGTTTGKDDDSSNEKRRKQQKHRTRPRGAEDKKKAHETTVITMHMTIDAAPKAETKDDARTQYVRQNMNPVEPVVRQAQPDQVRRPLPVRPETMIKYEKKRQEVKVEEGERSDQCVQEMESPKALFRSSYQVKPTMLSAETKDKNQAGNRETVETVDGYANRHAKLIQTITKPKPLPPVVIVGSQTKEMDKPKSLFHSVHGQKPRNLSQDVIDTNKAGQKETVERVEQQMDRHAKAIDALIAVQKQEEETEPATQSDKITNGKATGVSPEIMGQTKESVEELEKEAKVMEDVIIGQKTKLAPIKAALMPIKPPINKPVNKPDKPIDHLVPPRTTMTPIDKDNIPQKTVMAPIATKSTPKPFLLTTRPQPTTGGLTEYKPIVTEAKFPTTNNPSPRPNNMPSTP